MDRINRLRRLTSYTMHLFRTTAGRTPRARFRAMIAAHQREQDCSQCKTAPEHSFSHRVDNALDRSLVVALAISLWGAIAWSDRFSRGGW